MALSDSDVSDIVEIEQLLARYAVCMTRDDIEALLDVFTSDGAYSAFGASYTVADFPAMIATAPKGLFMTGTPMIELHGDTATGYQPLLFVIQTTHRMRIGYWTDTYHRTEKGWRLHRRFMTFLRRSGERDSGQPHGTGSEDAMPDEQD
jgi:hypothetical protein